MPVPSYFCKRSNLIRSFSLRAQSGGSSVKFTVSLPSAGKIGADANRHRPRRIRAFRASQPAVGRARHRFGPFGGASLRCRFVQIRKQEPERLLDCLLVSGLIEARSHERLGLLGEYCPDAELAKFYRSLMAKASPLRGILDFGNNLFRSPSCDWATGAIIIGRKRVAGNSLSPTENSQLKFRCISRLSNRKHHSVDSWLRKQLASESDLYLESRELEQSIVWF